MEKLKSNKWLSLISGILLLLAGVFYLSKPLQAVIGIGLFIGVLFLVKGISGLFSYRDNHESVRGAALASSILDIIMGFLLVSNIMAAALTIPYIIGFWVMFTGILEVVKSFSLKSIKVEKWWLVLVAGMFNILIAYMIMSNALASVLTMTIVLGIYFIVYGIMLIIHFFTLKRES